MLPQRVTQERADSHFKAPWHQTGGFVFQASCQPQNLIAARHFRSPPAKDRAVERLAVQNEARLCTVPSSAGPAKRLSHHRGRSSQGLRLGLRGFERAFFVVGSFRGAEIRRGLDKAQASSPSVACFGSPILALASLQFPSSQVPKSQEAVAPAQPKMKPPPPPPPKPLHAGPPRQVPPKTAPVVSCA